MTAHFARVLLDHLDECPVCGCPRITFWVPCEGICECECHDEPAPPCPACEGKRVPA